MIITHNGTILTNDGVVINNIITSPSFQNTYSLDFDGMDDYVDCGSPTNINSLPNLSISCWFKTTTTTNSFIIGSDSVSLGRRFLLQALSSSGIKVRFLYFTNPATSAFNTISSTSNVNDGLWHHVLAVNNGTSMLLYLDGILESSNSDGGVNFPQPTTPLNIGRRDYLGSNLNFNGSVDEVAIWGTDQSANIATLSTAPTVNLTPLNPIAWYRMGDNGAYKDPQWLIPSNENKDKVSNYILDFDGVNDYINLGDSDTFSFGNGTTDSPFSISAWIKMDSTSGFRIFHKSAGSISEYQFGTGGSNKLQMFIFDSSSNFKYRARVYNTILNTGQWYHVATTYSGVGGSNAQDGIKIYVDGVRVDDSSASGGVYVAMGNTTAPAYIGRLDSSYSNGSVDEVSVFNSELSASDIIDIYNGGEPTTLPSGAIAHYKMGEEATFSTNWTVPDQVGSNDGTSVNMTIEDRVGTAPSSSNNALSFNMDLIDRVEDTPPTP